MSHDLRNQADWLAGEGFLAAAPDLYYWGSQLRCLWTIMREVTAGQGRTVADIDAAREWLSAREDCTGRIGVIGPEDSQPITAVPTITKTASPDLRSRSA